LRRAIASLEDLTRAPCAIARAASRDIDST
jgi:hypothetical protein